MKGIYQVNKENWGQYLDLEAILQGAEAALISPSVYITEARALQNPGSAHDYYSNGDYWWPNPNTPDGLPYVRRDGESNPDNFHEHRNLLRRMRSLVACLTSAYRITGEQKYAAKAVQLLNAFFIDKNTRMNPHLLYAQAIPGVCNGRGIGVIDTLHLIDVAAAVHVLKSKDTSLLNRQVLQEVTNWFAQYLQWMNEHPQGVEERNEPNNHGICWFVQAAAFAKLTGHSGMLDYCREAYKSRLLPEQMDLDGSFPRELSRTKPYAYSLFTLDNFVTLTHILATPEDNLWEFQLPDGRGVQKGIHFLLPYLENKALWPYGADVEYDEDWPVAMSFFLFAGLANGSERLLALWRTLEQNPQQAEVRRNIAIRQPLLWL
ncbi:alginate lyase family protein [Paenibacillus chondroitinus]|uniref:Alginate lyase family protein n=1 Tax=Paenibacillus chondroitinus TaxID=59842 RepID=A0ABU6DFD2_9BACL|nr:MULTISPECIES: alginate lyase family protein [Paenibacillus]MCY9659200.1 alginate lyase family protein [Paenibacillus anseongense]MEB4796465.1 alginate lyase family protein [Paenibacillus chondroitinus]